MTRGSNYSHLDSLVSTTADHLVGHKVDAVHLVRMARQVDPDFVLLQIPQLGRESSHAMRYSL